MPTTAARTTARLPTIAALIVAGACSSRRRSRSVVVSSELCRHGCTSTVHIPMHQHFRRPNLIYHRVRASDAGDKDLHGRQIGFQLAHAAILLRANRSEDVAEARWRFRQQRQLQARGQRCGGTSWCSASSELEQLAPRCIQRARSHGRRRERKRGRASAAASSTSSGSPSTAGAAAAAAGCIGCESVTVVAVAT